MDTQLLALKKGNPKRIHYLFCAGDITPQTTRAEFSIGFIKVRTGL